MNAAERDDFAHALGQTMEFYGKPLEGNDFAFWFSAMGDKPVHAIKQALKDYIKTGIHRPRPANIMELINQNNAIKHTRLPAPEETTTNCPPEIAKAWMWFIGQQAKNTSMEGIFSRVDIDLDTQEKYLHVVNHEAKRLNNPDAIPAEYRLAEVWG